VIAVQEQATFLLSVHAESSARPASYSVSRVCRFPRI